MEISQTAVKGIFQLRANRAGFCAIERRRRREAELVGDAGAYPHPAAVPLIKSALARNQPFSADRRRQSLTCLTAVSRIGLSITHQRRLRLLASRWEIFEAGDARDAIGNRLRMPRSVLRGPDGDRMAKMILIDNRWTPSRTERHAGESRTRCCAIRGMKRWRTLLCRG